MWWTSQAWCRNKFTPPKQVRQMKIRNMCVRNCTTVFYVWYTGMSGERVSFVCAKNTKNYIPLCWKSFIVFASSGQTTKCVFMLGLHLHVSFMAIRTFAKWCVLCNYVPIECARGCLLAWWCGWENSCVYSLRSFYDDSIRRLCFDIVQSMISN